MPLSYVAAVLLSGISPIQGSPAPIIRDTFDAPRLSPAWKLSSSSGNSVDVIGGALRIVARTNTFANISRPIGIDLVTAQCRIKAAPAESWATSIFLYWGGADWCQLGIRQAGGGRVYMAQMAN